MRFLLLAGVLAVAVFASQSAVAQVGGGADTKRPEVKTNPFAIVVHNIDFVFVIICLCSIIGVTLIIQGFIKARASVMMPEESTNHIRELISQRQFKELIDYTETDPSFQFDLQGEYRFKGLLGDHMVYGVGWRS